MATLVMRSTGATPAARTRGMNTSFGPSKVKSPATPVAARARARSATSGGGAISCTSTGSPTAGASRAVGSGPVSTGRLEAFSDGVFAIAITLLVIELRPPHVERGSELAGALWDLWPSYFAYLVSFVTIGVMWLNHNRIFMQVRQVDGALLLLNL